MQKLSEDICHILSDYHSENSLNKFKMTPDHVLRWVGQFEEKDQEFILKEFLHILNNNTYISKEKAKIFLWDRINLLSKKFKFTHLSDFLQNVEFLEVQPDFKSQAVLIKMLKTIIKEKIDFDFEKCGTLSKKYVIYIDDILATGSTIFNDGLKWFKTLDNGKSNLQYVVNNEKIFIVSLFCLHNWGLLIKWKWKLALDNDSILKKVFFESNYVIENHPSFHNQSYNFAYPLNTNLEQVNTYFDSLNCTAKQEFAYRPNGKPVDETLFSSPGNRNRFENIILCKGIQLLNEAQSLKPNQRPLGMVSPSYKTFGTGTLFFTWRNISNTCPIVFWWKSSSWEPLFPLQNRGFGNSMFGI